MKLTLPSSGFKLCGVLYLNRISDNRMSGNPVKSKVMFERLCGEKIFAKKVVFVTTMWPEGENSVDWQNCVAQEKELQTKREYWANMIAQGSTTLRFKNTQVSAWSIIDRLIQRRDAGGS